MTMQAHMSQDGRVLTVSLPLSVRKRGGRKRIVVPDGTPAWSQPSARVDSTLVKAVARAHRWKNMLESGSYASVAELAAAERINASYLARVLRLTLLAPATVEAVLDGRHNAERVTLDRLMRPFPLQWEASVGASVVRSAPPPDP
jgi:hypothetical protein